MKLSEYELYCLSYIEIERQQRKFWKKEELNCYSDFILNKYHFNSLEKLQFLTHCRNESYYEKIELREKYGDLTLSNLEKEGEGKNFSQFLLYTTGLTILIIIALKNFF
jgi:hypothetical protein